MWILDICKYVLHEHITFLSAFLLHIPGYSYFSLKYALESSLVLYSFDFHSGSCVSTTFFWGSSINRPPLVQNCIQFLRCVTTLLRTEPETRVGIWYINPQMSHCAHHSSIAHSTALLLEIVDASRDWSTRNSEYILTELNCQCIKLPWIHRLISAL